MNYEKGYRNGLKDLLLIRKKHEARGYTLEENEGWLDSISDYLGLTSIELKKVIKNLTD